jgi:L-amino acid N-acyltransferase YncA
MNKDEKEIEKYKIAIDLLKYEGEMLWQIMSAYMIVNTVFLGFISQAAFKDNRDYTLHYDPICFLAGIFGLLLYENFINMAKSKGFTKIKAIISASNAKSISFHKNLIGMTL